MIITFASERERRLWTRLLELDGERCWERAQRRRERRERHRPTRTTSNDDRSRS